LEFKVSDQEIPYPPAETALGALLRAITEDKEHFQPTNINFGLLPPVAVEGKKKLAKDIKRQMQLDRAKESFHLWLSELNSIS
jgi:methylenetetrahydrofolate--tRNA-(uracil-5-)-methyltransferase